MLKAKKTNFPSSFKPRAAFAKRRNSASTFSVRIFHHDTKERKKNTKKKREKEREEKGVKYRVPSVPLALSSLRDRAAPVDSTYSRISLRFWYDGVSRDLCKMVHAYFLCIFRTNVRANEETNRLLLPTQMFQNSFILRNFCSMADDNMGVTHENCPH
ncbi:hypothetical protein PUN28_000658 [Cardiocondyla obscurior]|uniref:Uncharacterized protein n=1 Tax=Cardiocondyla obscurior TaxID=286306 RepID=A0AAW2H0E4_9HYME